MKLLHFIFLFFTVFSVNVQAAIPDTTQILDNIKKINVIMETNVDSGKALILENIANSKKLNFGKGTARSYLQLIQYYYFKGIPDSAIALIPELEKAGKESKDINLSVSILLKEAILYSDIGNFKNAIAKAIEAQKLAEGSTNYRLIAKVYHDLGLLYSNKSLYKNSLSYYKKGLQYAFKSNDTFSIANMYARIGGVFNETDIPDSGLYYNSIALKFFESIRMKRGIGVTYNNIAGSYELMKNYPKAIEYFNKALLIREELGDEYGITIINYNLGVCYLHMKKYDLAEKHLKISLERTKAEKDYPQILETLKQLCVLYSENNQLGAYRDHANEYMELKDSITSADNIKAISELQEQYESEKKEKNIVMLTKENEKQDAINRSERKTKFIILISSIVILLLMSVFGYILFKRYRITQKQKRIIELQKDVVEEQKNIVEEKQKELMDSINYAKRLQDAILPPLPLFRENLPGSFILYKPKDVVAGDFYWLEKVKLLNGEELVLFAAGDCTGHGVPGAMVSVVCSNALNRTVKEFGITVPGKILDKVRELVIETFEKSESEVRDGMDISLCTFNKNTKELKWAGANNPLWIVRDKQLMDLKPDKQPIGKVDNATPFKTETIQLRENDSIFLFTDGYADQFGGPKGKKFKYKQMQDVIMENVALSPEKQSLVLRAKIEEWQGTLEQIDDILVIGVRIL